MKQEQGYLDSQYNRLFMDKQVMSILRYIRHGQVRNISVTKEAIAKYMDDNEICSRPTTLKLIQRLLEHNIIVDDKKRDNTFSRLIINPSFDFRAIEMNLLTSSIKEIQQQFQDFDNETRGANLILVNMLLGAIDDFSKKEDIQRIKQSTKLKDEPEPIRSRKR